MTVQHTHTELWGGETRKAVDNFPVSGERVPVAVVRWLGRVKGAAARANADLGLLDQDLARRIAAAADEIAEGRHDDQFPIDVFQTGSGTSSNMNANEVIATLASRELGRPVHPNDHVNASQSSNDVFPSSIHLSATEAITASLIPALDHLAAALGAKASAWSEAVKSGRTHLMDATPVTLGQEFSGYEAQVQRGIERLTDVLPRLGELPLGGTAVGTGLNCHPDFPAQAIALIAEKTGIPFREAKDHFEAQAAKDGLVEVSGQVKTIATSLFKIANDVRWLSSGPQCGIGEISLPATQPGSSIMPGKVNPVMAESLMQVCARVMGNDATVTWCAANGNFELNVMMPALAAALLESIELLANAAGIFRSRCVEGIEAKRERCQELIEYSLAMVTGLNSKIGYDKASVIAKLSAKTGTPVRKLCMERLEELGITEAELTEALDPARMTAPNASMVGAGGG